MATVSVLLLSIPLHVGAQISPSSRSSWWASAGLGVGALNSHGDPAFAGRAALSYRFRHNLLTVRSTVDARLFGDSFWDVGILYGRAKHGPRETTSFSVGVGAAGGERGEGIFSNVTHQATTIAIPIEMQVFWIPTSVFGIGVCGFANINHEESFVGVVLTVEVGKLR